MLMRMYLSLSILINVAVLICNRQHTHITTDDLRIIKNNKLRKLLAKGPNYWESQTINFSKALTETITAVDTFFEAMTLKTKYTTLNFKPWKENVLA